MDQVIRCGRGFIRLVPASKLVKVGDSPIVQIKSDEHGAYMLAKEGGFPAYDVTTLWELRRVW